MKIKRQRTAVIYRTGASLRVTQHSGIVSVTAVALLAPSNRRHFISRGNYLFVRFVSHFDAAIPLECTIRSLMRFSVALLSSPQSWRVAVLRLVCFSVLNSGIIVAGGGGESR